MDNILKYGLNCFLLILPILLGNIIFAKKLPAPFQPDEFGKNIPRFIKFGEAIFRSAVLMLPLFMPLSISSPLQKVGIAVFVTGFILYSASWIAIIKFPGSLWSKSPAGFLAPAYTPVIWLAGIGLTADSFYFGFDYHAWIFYMASILFAVFHISHTYIIYKRISFQIVK